MDIRRATPADAPQIVRIYYDTIHKVNARDYTPEQLNAWAPNEPDPSEWTRKRLGTRITFVADDEGVVLAFAELDERGCIDCFYCHHDHQRYGIGSRILRAIERTAVSLGLSHLFTEASITARPFFEAHGFFQLKRQHVIRREISLPNFIMVKNLSHRNGSEPRQEWQLLIGLGHNRT
jgi:putative acetyltransferase